MNWLIVKEALNIALPLILLCIFLKVIFVWGIFSDVSIFWGVISIFIGLFLLFINSYGTLKTILGIVLLVIFGIFLFGCYVLIEYGRAFGKP